MANVIGLKDNESNVLAGLGTWTYNVPATAIYEFTIQSNLAPPSNLSIVINRNGSPIASNGSVTNTTHTELSILQPCTASDVITFVLTSSTFIDEQPQSIKSIVLIVPENANV